METQWKHAEISRNFLREKSIFNPLSHKCASENPQMATPIDGLECRLQFRTKSPKPCTRGLPRLSPGDQAIQSKMTSTMFKNGVIEYQTQSG